MIELGSVYRILPAICAVVLGIFIIYSIIRSVLGPRTADRVITVNMVGTTTIIIIAIFSIYLDENYLVDVGLIYAMTSSLAVIVPYKVYIGVYQGRKEQQEEKED